MASQYYIVGISGVTNGGKTTLTEKLKNHIPDAHVLYLDDYFWLWPQHKDKFIWLDDVNHANWEDVSALDYESILKDVQKWIDSVSKTQDPKVPAILLLDGFLLYNYPPLVPYFSKKYYLTLDEEECRKRRMSRTYDPSDPPGYFEKCVWPMHIKNKKAIENIKEIVYIDGKLPQEEVFAQAIKGIADLVHLPLEKS